MSADIATDLLCEELILRSYQVEQIYMQGDILPIVKHLAFAGRFRRIDLQPIIQRIRRKQSRGFDFGKWVYRPREANVLADYFAGIASKAAPALAANHSDPVEIAVEAPYHLALKSGAVILDEKPSGSTILLLTETTGIDIAAVKQFAEQTANAQYRKELQAYLAGTANLTKPLVLEYTASATDQLGRLYGRGPCAQRLPRKLRLLLLGTTHQEVDMIGSFYEIMRRLSSNNCLPCIAELRSILTDLLGLVSSDQRASVVKRHPLIVMNAGAKEACAKIERGSTTLHVPWLFNKRLAEYFLSCSKERWLIRPSLGTICIAMTLFQCSRLVSNSVKETSDLKASAVGHWWWIVTGKVSHGDEIGKASSCWISISKHRHFCCDWSTWHHLVVKFTAP